MENFFIHIASSCMCLSIFLGVYYIFLRKNTFFRFNRIFLLLGILGSFILPFIEFSYDVVIPYIPAYNQVTDTGYAIAPIDNNIFTLWNIVGSVYILGICVLFIRNARVFWLLRQLKKNGSISSIDGFKVVENSEIGTPFSALNHVFINTKNISEVEKDIIIKHEISHINQKHWVDLLCSECALLLQWFNPLMWLYIKFQKENHEYLADQAVLQNGESKAVYRAVLINQRFQGPVFSFANSFNYSNQLNRLDMMKKTKTSPWKKIAVLTVLPVFGVFFALSAKPNYIIEPAEAAAVDTAQINIRKALVFIDGVESNYEELEKLDMSLLKSMEVIKDEQAAIYGDKAKYGVVKATTLGYFTQHSNTPVVEGYKGDIEANSRLKGKVLGAKSSDKGSILNLFTTEALCIVDGVEATQAVIQVLQPNDIESISVLKDDKGVEIYGEKARKGAILITTKKALKETSQVQNNYSNDSRVYPKVYTVGPMDYKVSSQFFEDQPEKSDVFVKKVKTNLASEKSKPVVINNAKISPVSGLQSSKQDGDVETLVVDLSQINVDIANALKDVDLEYVEATIAKALDNIDTDRIIKEVRTALENVDRDKDKINAEISNALQSVAKAQENAEQARVNAEIARANAAQARKDADAARNNAEVARENGTKARANAEIARANATQARKNAVKTHDEIVK